MTEKKHIGPLIRMLENAIEQKMNNDVSQMELTSAQIFTLHFLCKNEKKDICQKDIEAFFGLSHATVSGIISRLEAKGFLESVSAEDDRRKKLIRATGKAKKCDSTVAEQIKETEELLLKNFSEKEKEMLFIYILRMLDNIGVHTPEKREDEKC
ncbi:MAG: winged helix-turn-helix transcriptional regulator [Clostridia bacterium]|nr:winged helix-turn-helix transcriptional regulator [Clostridia bacterium]